MSLAFLRELRPKQPLTKLQKTTLAVFALSTLWAIFTSALTGLTDQEAYYWTWSQHLDLGYLEHPPLQAWVTRSLTTVFGHEAWVLRLPATLIGRVIAFGYFYRWARLRYSEETALYGLQFLCSSFFILAGSIITLPDAFLFPGFCAMIYYSEKKEVSLTGIALGLAVLSKWTALLFVPGLVFRFYSKKQPLKGLRDIALIALISVAFQIPVLMWNLQNDWASVKFHLRDRHPTFDWSWFKIIHNFIGFSASQLGLAGFSLVALLFLFTQKKIRHSNAPLKRSIQMQNLWAWILPAYLVVGYSALRGEMRFYWTAPALILIIPALLSRLSLKTKGPSVQRASWVALTITILLASLVIYFPVGEYLRPLVESYRSYDIRFSPRGDLEGWRQVADQIQKAGLIKEPEFFVGGSDFRLSAQTAWGFKVQDVRRIVVGAPTKSQYAFWMRDLPVSYKGHQAFFFGDNRYRDTHEFEAFCTHPLTWNSAPYRLGGYMIKEIKWAECHSLKATLP